MLNPSKSLRLSDPADMDLTAYSYVLPDGLIAQRPVVPRDSSRLLVVERTGFRHQIFDQIAQYLQPGDLLILNNTRVIPARLLGRKVAMTPKASGTTVETPSVPVEVFLLEPRGEHLWLALVKPGRRLKPGARIEFGGYSQPLLTATVVETDPETRGRLIQFEVEPDQNFEALLAELGQLPLPPYIESDQSQPEQYQTVFAKTPGAVAGPYSRTALYARTPPIPRASGNSAGLRDASRWNRDLSSRRNRKDYRPHDASRVG